MLSLIVSLLVAMTAVGAQDELADMIIRSAKTESGLCLYVGCGEGNLTLALSQRGRFLVYGLETDQARAREAQELIPGQGCYGQAWVEHRRVDALPLAENPVNLVVVENDESTLRFFVDGEVIFVESEKQSIVGKNNNHVGFYFYTAAKVKTVRVYVKESPSDLGLD